MTQDPVNAFLPAPTDDLVVEPLLDAIDAQAVDADATRSVDAELILAIKRSGVLDMSASLELGGSEQTVEHFGRELEAVAARCPSTAWCLWNHLCVFHLFVGALGPRHLDFLCTIVTRQEWVSFPAGAGSSVYGRITGDQAVLSGSGAFGTGARYADWCGVVFAVVDDHNVPVRPLDLRFTMVRTDEPGVTVDQTWDGAGLRASATDDIRYADVRVELDKCTRWFGANRAESLRTVPVIHHRYREDWVGLSDLWLGWMAAGLVRACVREAATSFRSRRVIMGNHMIDRPTVQLNVGRALALTAAARAAVAEACHEVDRRIAARQTPDASDYFRQQAVVTMALEHLSEAMALLTRTHGGNGLRESASFDRRSRDFRAMPLHINVHQDRITHQVGRLALGIELDAF